MPLMECDFADTKEVVEGGRGVADAVLSEMICRSSSALICSSDEFGGE